MKMTAGGPPASFTVYCLLVGGARFASTSSRREHESRQIVHTFSFSLWGCSSLSSSLQVSGASLSLVHRKESAPRATRPASTTTPTLSE
eukprot:scaffold207769_cov37-Tisochrysis_lutea.AAC.1